MKTILNSFLSHKDIGNFGLSNVLTNLETYFKKEGYRVININFFNSITLDKVIKSNIIHIHGCWSMVHLLIFLLGKFYNKKIFISPHGMLDPYSLDNKKIKKMIAWFFYQKMIIKNCDAIIVNSVFEKNNLKRLIKKKNIIVIFHGINDNKKKFKTNKKISFVYFSKIHPIKCPLELITIWNKSKILSKYKLNLYGKIEDKKYFELMKPILSKNNNITYKGILNDKNKFKNLAKHNFLIHTSRSENFGLVILESLASGLFIICRDTLPWKILEKKGVGKMIKIEINYLEKNIPILIKKIKSLKSITQSKRISNFLEENYNWKKIIKKYEYTYNNI